MRLIDADELIRDMVSNDPVVIAAQCAPTIEAEQARHGGDCKGTNAEVIRSMTDKELAHWLSTTFCHGYGEADFLVWLTESCEKDVRRTENALESHSGFSLSRCDEKMDGGEE